MPMSRDGIERLRRRADAHVAGFVGVQPGENLQQRGLAAAGRADQRDQLARLDVERRLGDREEIRAARAVDLLHAGEMDERLAHGVYWMRASRTTSSRSRPSTMPYSTTPMRVIRITAMNMAAVSSVTCTCSIR